MKRVIVAAVAVVGLASTGCNKPAEQDCRKAIQHMQELIGTSSVNRSDAEIEGEVRRCRGGSSREAVACAIQATTIEQLKACAFMSPPAKP